DNTILIIDDVRSHDYGEYSWNLHPSGQSSKNGIDIEINNGSNKVKIRPLYPEYLTESDFEHDFPDHLKLKTKLGPIAKEEGREIYYTVTDPHKRNNCKFITAIMLPDSSGNLDEAMQIDCNDGCGVRIISGDKTTDVFLNNRADGHIMHRNSCNTFGEFDSDAYILAYSYPSDKTKPSKDDILRWFVAYGSYVRVPDEKTSCFDSFTKQTKIW
ncbi:MAG: hypothetical protein K2K97_08315, partial [Muribaculaceae bacterium]|nr:hypothetical protein [Muribaculaceae bacterium]